MADALIFQKVIRTWNQVNEHEKERDEMKLKELEGNERKPNKIPYIVNRKWRSLT